MHPRFFIPKSQRGPHEKVYMKARGNLCYGVQTLII